MRCNVSTDGIQLEGKAVIGSTEVKSEKFTLAVLISNFFKKM